MSLETYALGPFEIGSNLPSKLICCFIICIISLLFSFLHINANIFFGKLFINCTVNLVFFELKFVNISVVLELYLHTLNLLGNTINQIQ